MRNKKKGFSLLELLIVIGIIGIIAVIAVPKYSNYVKTAKVKSDVASARTIADAFKLYFFEDGEKAISGLDLTKEANTYVKALEKYISKIPEVKSEDNAHFVVNTTEEGEITVFIAEIEGDALEDSDKWVQKYPVETYEEQGDKAKE